MKRAKLISVSLGDHEPRVRLWAAYVSKFEPINKLMDPIIPLIRVHFKDGSKTDVRYLTEENRDAELNYLESFMQTEQVEKVELPTIATIREKGIKFEPESSSVKTLTFYSPQKLLLVDFPNGNAYLYENVEIMDFDALVGASSAGKELRTRITGQPHKFPFKKIRKDDKGIETV